ncbi:type II secretion system protein N [Oceanobacter kriegii]|uniref:type II secretion system protein N n=1 Tax=Oceanobacter kriegii TaxID=64972 RepID=UPI0004879177|nr:type II secretion system protein N [Oceanobacter kriegii]
MKAVELPRWQKLTLISGKLLLTLLISWQLSQLIWAIVAPQPLILMAPTKGDGSTVARAEGTAQYHLFGEASELPAPVIAQPVDAPETRLKLTLLGVNAANPEENSSAIIAVSGRAGDFFRLGDTVQGRTRLVGVYPHKVMLDTSGKLETLKFDDEPNRGSDVRSVPAPSRAEDLPERLTQGSLTQRFRKVRNATEFVGVATSEIADDPLAALNKMGLEPQGAGSGYRVKPGSPLMQFKLRPGDIVLSINSQSLGDPASDQSLLADLPNADEVRIEVQRGNSRFNVNHRLD